MHALLLLLLCPDAHVDCRLFVGHGVFGFLATALSSLQRDVRLSACHCLTRFRGHLEESRFREKPQVRGREATLEGVVFVQS